ncbi:MAG: hypothetical protein ACI9SB_000752 [Candidatus Azotimanducaceae bacterium]
MPGHLARLALAARHGLVYNVGIQIRLPSRLFAVNDTATHSAIVTILERHCGNQSLLDPD